MADYATVPYLAGNHAERRFDRIIGNSAALECVLDQVELVAPTDSTVLIEGETGTGKELIAHAVHNASQRCGRAFIKVSCAAIPLDLLESVETLERVGWIVVGPRGAAAKLGLKRTTLLAKMRRLGIYRPIHQEETDVLALPPAGIRGKNAHP
jgi:transcriptional regulator with GAF, ATPase, and Fis domain